jgi:hypothetical protein
MIEAPLKAVHHCRKRGRLSRCDTHALEIWLGLNRLTLLLLLLPLLLAAGAAAAQNGSIPRHTVKAGDTLISICQQAVPPCDWREVQRVNSVNNELRLVPGQVLLLASPPAETALQVDVLHAHGQVTVSRERSAATPLIGGAQLRVGDTVRTGPQSSASMRLPDGSRLVMHANSVVVLERLIKRQTDAGQDTQLQLQRGTLDTRVPAPTASQPVPRLQIRTHVANLGVRGTEFRTRVTSSRMVLEVLQGQVEATAVGKPLAAAPALAAGSATPSAAPLDPAAPPTPAAAALVEGGSGLFATPEGLSKVRVLPPAPDLQTLPVLVQHLPLLLDFTGTAPATNWRARISASGAPEQPLLEGVFDSPMARWADSLPDGAYELRVRAADDAGLEGPDAIATFVLKARPLAPLRLQADAAASAAATAPPLQARLAWQAEPQAASYQVQVADDNSFNAPRALRRGVTATCTW